MGEEIIPFGLVPKQPDEVDLRLSPGSHKNRYSCRNCGELFMSDESLQLHRIGEHSTLVKEISILRRIIQSKGEEEKP